jgi:hypothetical protein
VKIPIDPTRHGGGLEGRGRDRLRAEPWKLLPIPVRHGLAAQVRPSSPGDPSICARMGGCTSEQHYAGDVGWSARSSTARGTSSVAEGGSLIVAKEVPSVGALQLDLRF